MPGDPSISANKLPSQASKRRDPEAVPAPARPEATLAALETELARARAEYAARSATVKQVLEDIGKHLTEAQPSAPPGLEPEFALLEAKPVYLPC
jgi:hypothetical protein